MPLLLAALQAAVADPEFAAQAQPQDYVRRCIGPSSWQPMLRRTLAELGDLWPTAPWTMRQD